MSLTTEELMRPRWEVIADYPNSVEYIGSVIENKDPEHYDLYPSTYRPLSWWEHRLLYEMPQYVKASPGHYNGFFVEELSQPNSGGWVRVGNMRYNIARLSGLLPATKEEYEAYKATQEGEKA